MAGYERDMDRPTGRETGGTGMGRESGESSGVFVAEYDLIPESDRLTTGREDTGKRGGKQAEGGEETGARESRRTSIISGTAQGEKVDVKGVVGTVKAEEVKITGVSAIVTGGEVEMTGWAPIVMASKEVEVEKGACAVALAGKKVEVEENGYLAFGIAPKIEVEEGGKVFVTLPMAIAAGLAFGVGWVVAGMLGLLWLRRQGGLRGMMMRRRARQMGFSRMQTRTRGMTDRFGRGDD